MPERFKKLKELAAFLRGPEGCPWDKKQTIKSMLKNISDEAKEVEDAINNESYLIESKDVDENGDLEFVINRGVFPIVQVEDIQKFYLYFYLILMRNHFYM